MCTAVALGGFFGRNLDLEGSMGEQLAVAPRRFPLPPQGLPGMELRYAVAGTALVREGFPLYFDAVNEAGLAMAGLDFPGGAHYRPRREGMVNVAPFALIPFVLGTCADVAEARRVLRGVNLWDEPFSPDLPLTPLHWMLADRRGAALAVEPGPEGLRVLDAPAGVLTNRPDLEEQMAHLARFEGLTPADRGLGLPGDHSSPSRFVRTAFHRAHTPAPETGGEGLARCLRILDCAAVPRGSSLRPDGRYRYTVYTSCCDLSRGDYFIATEENRRLTGVSLGRTGEDRGLWVVEIPREQDVGWVD